MRLLLLNCLISISIVLAYSTKYQYRAEYKRSDGDYQIYWTVNIRMKNISFKICKNIAYFSSKPLWMGIGFSDRGQLDKADVFAVNFKTYQFLDLHTNTNGILRQDYQINYISDQLFQLSNKLCFSFHRKWNTCDKFDYAIDRGTTNILLFTSTGMMYDIVGSDLHMLDPFGISLQLIRSTISVPYIPHSTPIIEVTVDQVQIPSSKTTYWCKVVMLPNLMEKHHIIKFEPIISAESEGIVHHMELFHCTSVPDDLVKNYNAPCNSESKPMGLTMCRKVIAAWAMGARAFLYPEDVGNPLGGPGFMNYAILEVHYNNPDQKKGIVDNSGLRMFYTKRLRKFDSGIIEIGLEYTNKNSIPPGQDNFVLSGFCLNQCTKQALPKQGIHVFASQLHTHLTGVKVEIRHFRKDVELSPLNRDGHYQPHYQEIRLLPKIVHVLPGDQLVTSCTYRTTNRTEMTLGGISILNEMCISYIFYYPRMDLELCKSSVSDNSILTLLNGASNLERAFNKIDWSEKNSKLLETFYEHAPIHQSCNMSDSQSFKGHWDGISPPILTYDRPGWEKENYNCFIEDFVDL